MTLTDPTNGPVVDAKHLDVALDGTPVLHDVSLRVGAGETVALLGGNGSGKTTTLRAILGLIPHDAGDIELFGQPLGEFHDWGRLGYVPQRGAVQVGTATVGELVASGRLPHRRVFHPMAPDDRSAIADALATVNLNDIARQRVAHLSGGQRQRALIARAMATRPQLIVLDEPLAGLDTATQDELADVLGRLKASGVAVLVVLHELGPLESLIDRGVVLRQGRVIYEGALRSAPDATGHTHAHDADDALSPNTAWTAGLGKGLL